MIFHVLRLQPEQDLLCELQQFLNEKNIGAAFLGTCVGSLKQLKIRFAHQKSSLLFEENFEIITLNGTLSNQGCHLHGSFSNSKGEVLGGHITQGCLIKTTAELIVTELTEWKFERKKDDQTGYLELVPFPKR